MKQLIAAILFVLASLSGSLAEAQELRAPAEVQETRETLLLPEGWVSQAGLYTRIHGPPGQALKLAQLLEHAEESTPRLAELLDLPTGQRIEIFLTQSQEQFFSLQPGSAPHWADATAYPKQGWIFLRRNGLRGGMASSDIQVLDHELVHVLLGQAFQEKRPPQWLQEGVAQVFAGEYTLETADRIAEGMLGRGLFSLGELSHSFPRDPVRAQLAYAQSADFIAWLMSEYGSEVLPILVRESVQGASFEAALRRATGKSLAYLDKAWSKRLENSWLWVRALANDTVLLGLATIFLVVGYLRVKRRNGERLAEMARQDALEDRLMALLAEQDVESKLRGGGRSAQNGDPKEHPWLH
jgi:hypothetical protein